MIPKYPETMNAVIAIGTSLSTEIDTQDFPFIGVIMPAAWTAANLTFQVASRDAATGGVYSNLFDDVGQEVVVSATAGRAIAIDAAALKLAPFSYLRVRSGTSATPVNQAAERTLVFVMKG